MNLDDITKDCPTCRGWGTVEVLDWVLVLVSLGMAWGKKNKICHGCRGLGRVPSKLIL